MSDNVAAVLLRRGGRLDPATVDGAAGEHLANATSVFRGYLERILTIDGSLVVKSTPPSRISQFEFVRRWDVNAWAVLAEERPVVLFHAGIPFCLFEYFNGLLAQPDILSELDGSAERSAPFAAPTTDFTGVAASKWPSSVPFTDSEQARRSASWSSYLRTKPRSELRRQLALQAYLTAVQFLFLHELGHIDCGHLEYRRRDGGSSALCELGADNDGGAIVSAQQALEFDADRYATARTIGPYLARRAASNLPPTKIAGAAPGTSTCYRVVLFTIGALFLLLQKQVAQRSRLSRWSSILHFGRRPLSSHPPSFVRIHAALGLASLIAGKNDPSPEPMHSARLTVLRDLQAVAELLGTDASGISSTEPLDQVLALVREVAALEPELEVCRKAVSDRYFHEGRAITLAEALSTVEPIDIRHLKDQSLSLEVDGERINIPFLTESSPTEEFLDNSTKWERAGFLDNATIYAVAALSKDPGNPAVEARVQSLRRTLGPSFAKLEQLIATHGPISHLAEHLIEKTNSDPELATPEKIIEVYETLVALRPREGSWRLGLADRRLLHRDSELALNDYLTTLALRLEPEERIGALVGAGNACAELGRTDEACGYFRKALAENPRSAYAWENLVICLVRGRRPADAVASLQDALKADDKNPEYWFLTAAAHHALGNTAQVAEATEEAVRLAPNKPKYVLALAQLESEIKHYHRAIELYTHALKVLDEGADQADALLLRGRARQAVGEIDGARADYTAVEALAGPLAAQASQALRGLQQPPSSP